MDSQYHCYYVDHSFFPPRKISEFYSQIIQDASLKDAKDSLVIATCQRIEIYTIKEENPLVGLPLPFRHISTTYLVKQRLISIAAGVESQILAEKNILHQVDKARATAVKGNVLEPLFLDAIRLAFALRDKFSFYAGMDYENISLEVLKNKAVGAQIGISLVVIGSGMLARTFVNKQPHVANQDVFFITRSPKPLRKKLGGEFKHKIYRAHEFIDRKTTFFYQCVIATNNMEKDYIEEVRGIVLSNFCLGVFDLSAIPAFNGQISPKFYADIYTDEYFSIVKRYNDTNQHNAEMIKKEILKIG